MDNIKERSATGLQYVVEKHTKMEVKINLMPTYIIIPYGGVYKTNNESSLLILDLGRVLFQSEPRIDSKNVASMASSGISSEEILSEMIDQCYDRFKLEIQEIQVLVVRPQENWQEVIDNRKKTDMHLLEPTSIMVSAHLCVVDDDPRLPKTKIYGEIPSIRVSVTEDRLLQAIGIGTSIPLPESDELEPLPLAKKVKKKKNNNKLIKIKLLINFFIGFRYNIIKHVINEILR